MEKAAFLMPVDRVVGRVQVQDDFARGLGPEGAEEEVDEHGLDRSGIMPDLVIAPAHCVRRRMFQPVERALAGQGRGSDIILLEPAQERPKHGVMTQVVVIDEVLISERQAEDALTH
jgi:hypothetical protein